MAELEIAPSTIEVGEKASVELSPFELQNRSKRREDFTKVVGAIASGNPESALEYEAEYGLEDDYAEDQKAIQTFVALQQAANGDKNAAMSLFNTDEQMLDSVSRMKANPQRITPEEKFSYSPPTENAYSTDFTKLSRQRLALGGLPGTMPVDQAYLQFLGNKQQNQPLSVAAAAGIGQQNVEAFGSPQPTQNLGAAQNSISFAEQASTMMQGSPTPTSAGATSAGATLATAAPDLAMATMRGGINPEATALSQTKSVGPNTKTAVDLYSNLGAASTVLNNKNLDLTNINTVAAVTNLGLNTADTLSRLSNFDMSTIPNEVTGFFDRVGNFVETLVNDPVGTINSALGITGTATAYGGDISAPVAVQAVPEAPFVFDANTLEASTTPGFLQAIYALSPAAIGLTSRISGMVQDRDVNQLSDFSKAKSYQAWDMVTAHTAGELGISDQARSAGVQSLGVGFSGQMSATINGINVSFDPFAENPANTMTSFVAPEKQFTAIDPIEVVELNAQLESKVEALSQAVKSDPDFALNYATTLSDVMNAGLEHMDTLSFSQMDIGDENDLSYADPTDLAAADYGAGTKEAIDNANAAFAAGQINNIQYAEKISGIATGQGAQNAGLGRSIAKATLGNLATPAYGTGTYYASEAEKAYSRAVSLSEAGQNNPDVADSFAGVGQGIANDYNSPNPSDHTIDIMDRAGLSEVSVNAEKETLEILGNLSLNSSRSISDAETTIDPDTTFTTFELDPTESGVVGGFEGGQADADAQTDADLGFDDDQW